LHSRLHLPPGEDLPSQARPLPASVREGKPESEPKSATFLTTKFGSSCSSGPAAIRTIPFSRPLPSYFCVTSESIPLRDFDYFIGSSCRAFDARAPTHQIRFLEFEVFNFVEQLRNARTKPRKLIEQNR
jgi:hypothetical protein